MFEKGRETIYDHVLLHLLICVGGRYIEARKPVGALPFYCVGLRDQIQAVRPGHQGLYQLNHLSHQHNYDYILIKNSKSQIAANC